MKINKEEFIDIFMNYGLIHNRDDVLDIKTEDGTVFVKLKDSIKSCKINIEIKE